jgi:hypothetical protein
MSVLQHFGSITKGVLGLGDLVFFVSVIMTFLFVNIVVVELKKAD